jgi:hypothetical protein
MHALLREHDYDLCHDYFGLPTPLADSLPAGDAGLRKRFADAGRKLIATRFTRRDTALRYEAIFQATTGCQPPRIAAVAAAVAGAAQDAMHPPSQP